jgi:glycosyltransferase involved in cell wall biosynthesis
LREDRRTQKDIPSAQTGPCPWSEDVRRKDLLISNLEEQLQQIQRGIVMQLVNKYQRVVEKLLRTGTRRRYYYELGLTGLRVILNEGWRSFLKKTRYWLEHRFFPLDAVPRTLRYYKVHGLRQTVITVRAELSRKGAIAKDTIEVYVPSTSKEPTTTLRKVSFLPGDLIDMPWSQSRRYRVFNIIEGLTAKGIQCNVFFNISPKNLKELLTSDLVVIFKAPLSKNIQIIIDTFKQHNIPLVFDIDDLIFEPESANCIYGWREWSASQKYEYPRSYRDTIDRCDFATCPTDYLANKIRARGKETFVIPNTINEAQYELAEKLIPNKYSEKDNKIKIGYFSGANWHDKDFLEAAEALCEILERYESTEFHIVGDVHLPEAFKMFGNRIVSKPFMPYLDMLEYLFQMDINIAPLEQNIPINEGKSELKMFEAALVSVPTIASRTDSYIRCIVDGKNGFLAGSKEAWIQKLVLLVENKELRENVGANARKDFVSKFYIENVTGDVIKAYEDMVSTYLRGRILHYLKPKSVHQRKLLAEKTMDRPAAVAIALAKNEGDIIRAWMSHTCALFDMVYVVDHLSIDGTREFLLQMAEARDNIKVFSFEHPGYFQAGITNQLAEIAAHDYPDSWIFPLDADEFLSITSRAELLSRIKDVQSDWILRLHWKNCMPMCLTADKEFTFASPCLISPFRGVFNKVAIHSSAFTNKNWRFVQGNHRIKDSSGNTVVGDTQIDLVEMLHMPIRSLDHFALKCIQGYLAYDALPAAYYKDRIWGLDYRKDIMWGFHWRQMIEMVLKQEMLSPDVVRELVAHYSEPQSNSPGGVSISEMIDAGWICAPLYIAHTELPHQIHRRYKFLELAKEILSEHKNKNLQDFLNIVAISSLRAAAETDLPL